MLAQFCSTGFIDFIQKTRCEILISEFCKMKVLDGKHPLKYPTTFGISYKKISDKDEFILKYSRGFMIFEEYSSELKTWDSKVWNN